MIVDALARGGHYFDADWWHQAIAFAAAATPDLADGEQPIAGRSVFAKIMSFTSGTAARPVLESHRAYADIHVVLGGCETIKVWPAESLTPLAAFDTAADVVFYSPPAAAPVTVSLHPGTFALFLPQDAHMPTLACESPAPVKKLVIKLAMPLFHGANGTADMKGVK